MEAAAAASASVAKGAVCCARAEAAVTSVAAAAAALGEFRPLCMALLCGLCARLLAFVCVHAAMSSVLRSSALTAALRAANASSDGSTAV